eukprot:351361-Chlamydomonas_euryale.AAC.7
MLLHGSRNIATPLSATAGTAACRGRVRTAASHTTARAAHQRPTASNVLLASRNDRRSARCATAARTCECAGTRRGRASSRHLPVRACG